jgi:uncharacterized protein YvpB
MKKLLILLTSTIALSSIILGSYRDLNMQSTFDSVSSPSDRALVIEQLNEGQDDLSLSSLPSSRRGARREALSKDKVNTSDESSYNAIDDQRSENSPSEDHSNQEIVSAPSPIVGGTSFEEGFITRLPMEDEYHSQISETSLPNACGPTALMMALDYFELEESLAEVIQKLRFSPEQGGYDPLCTANPVCTSPGALVQVAGKEYGLLVDAHEGWTFDEIQNSIALGQPIIADIVWRLADEGPGHFVVIYGIDTEHNLLFYHDPYDGAEKVASWEEFSTAWDGPVDRGDPLQPQGFTFWGMSLAAG